MADCIARAMDFGEIDRARGQAALDQYTQLVARYETIMGPDAAAQRAAEDMKKATKAAKTQRAHKVVNQLQAMRRLKNLVETAPDPALALRNLLEYSEGSGFRGESVRSIQEAYEVSIAAGLSEMLEKVGLNVIGSSRDAELLEKIVLEAHGTATGDASAKGFATALQRTQQRMRRLFNAHGGNIGELADYGLPHSHDAATIRQAGFDAWAARVHELAAWDRITDFTTGQPFASAPGSKPPRAEVDAFLRDVYDGITTGGWDRREPSMSVGGKALYNQRAEHRVLHFRDGQAWLDYNRDFGASDPFSAMMNGLHGMARDVALMRVLGPSPKLGLEFAAQVAQKRAADLRNPKLADRVSASAKLARVMLSHVDGAANVPHSIDMARFFSGTRAVLASAQLGSAVLSSVTDVATITSAAQHMGMNARNVLGRSVELMKSQATRQTAARMGYVAGSLADAGSGSARYFGRMFGNGLPERLAGFTLRATGLNFVTDMRKVAFQMEFAGFLAEHADAGFAALPDPLRRAMEARGITPADWDLLRAADARFRAPNGADFISPVWWLEHQTALPRVEAEGLAMRMQALVQEQLEYAIPTASLEGRARLQGDAPPGTVSGELLRSAMTYKSFALSLTLGQYRRFAAIEGRWNKAKYAAKASAMLLVLGAVAVQLKELAKGNDPRPMTEGKFWWAALFQGGGLGIFGDFFAAEQNRMGGGLGQTVAGPVIGFLGDMAQPFASNLNSIIQGNDTHLGRDVSAFAQRNTPFLSSSWYARTAYSRLVMDEVSRFLDPEADRLWQRRLKKQLKDYGTSPWWAPGEKLPARAPDLGNALR
jgi:hypothetical protein